MRKWSAWESYFEDPEFAKWWDAAEGGEATSAAYTPEPEIVTPPFKNLAARAFDVGKDSPSVPQPMRKRQLAASKRLEAQLSANRQKPGDDAAKEPSAIETPTVGEGDKPRKKNPTTEKVVKQKVKSKAKTKPKVSKAKVTETKKERKAPDGPLGMIMKEFMDKTKQSGVKHREALKLWKTSAERSAVVAKLPPREVKRRRY